MRKKFFSILSRSLAVLAVAAVISTGFKTPALADEENPEEVVYADPCAGGHVPDDGTIEANPTCTENGVIRYRCYLCNTDLGTQPIPAVGHNQDGGTQTSEPTCTNAGTITYKCTRCGADMGTADVPATGHVKDGGTVLTTVTCTQPGIIQYKCSKCGADMGSDNTPALGHSSDEGTVVKQPTATTQGEIEYKCTRCGIVLREEPIPCIAKRATPQAVFNTETLVLSNIPENSMVVVNGNPVNPLASGTESLAGMFPQVGDYSITVQANVTATQAASDVQTIHIRKPVAPSHIQTVDEPVTGGNGAIGGVDTSMEYALQNSNTWVTCTSSSQPVPSGIYIVRYKATANSIASDAVEALVKKATQTKPEKPQATFDGASHQLRNVRSGMVYSTNSGDTWTKITDTYVTLSNDAVNQAVSYKGILVKNVINNVESDIQTVAVARQAQPTGLSVTPATSGNNGTIKGVGTDMQYRKEGSDTWIDIGSNTISGLSKGKYFIRRKASNAVVESNAAEVYVDDKQSGSKETTPKAQFNAYNMHLDCVAGCRVSFDGGNTWTDKINDSTYIVNESLLNISRGIIVYREGSGSTANSDRQYIALTKQPTPTGITATSATATVPGTISGTDSTMQFKAANQSSWIDITQNVIPVQAGTYYIRRHGYGTALPSDWLTVVIKATTTVTPTTPASVVPSSTGTGIVVDNQSKKEEDEKKKQEEEAKKKQEEEAAKEETAAENTEAAGTETTQADAMQLNAAMAVDGQVFVDAAAKDVPIVIVADADTVWSIAPSDINVPQVSSMGSIDLGITENTGSIPEEAIATVADAAASQVVDHTFDIKHEGEFGFTANLTIKVSDTAKGKYANLYYYNKETGKLEFIGTSPVNENGQATFRMSHASSYVVVVSETAMSQDSVKEVKVSTVSSNDTAAEDNTAAVTTNTTDTTAKKSSPVMIILIIIIVLLAAGLGFVIWKKKQIEKKHSHHKYH